MSSRSRGHNVSCKVNDGDSHSHTDSSDTVTMRDNDESKRKYSNRTDDSIYGGKVSASYDLTTGLESKSLGTGSYGSKTIVVYSDKVGNYGSNQPGEYESQVGKYE